MDSGYLEVDSGYLEMDSWYLKIDSGYLEMESWFPENRIGVHGDGLYALGDKSIHLEMDSRLQEPGYGC